jgi:hypothetical protein
MGDRVKRRDGGREWKGGMEGWNQRVERGDGAGMRERVKRRDGAGMEIESGKKG